MSEQGSERPRRRRRQLPNGGEQVDDGVDRGDGRTSFGTFPEGRSGNPHGRPKGSLNAATIIRQELTELVVMKTADGSRQVSKYAASVAKLVSAGLMQNSVRALERVIALGLALEEKPEPTKAALPLTDADRAVLALLAKRQAARAAAATASVETGSRDD